MSFLNYTKNRIAKYESFMGEYVYPDALKALTKDLSIYEQTKYLYVSIKDVYNDKGTIERSAPITEALYFYGIVVDEDKVVGLIRKDRDDSISYSLLGQSDHVYESEDNEGAGYKTLDSYERVDYSLNGEFEAFYPITRLPSSVTTATEDLIKDGKTNAVCFGENVKKIEKGAFDKADEIFYFGNFASWLEIEGKENINASVRFLKDESEEIENLVLTDLEVIPDHAFHMVCLESLTLPANLKEYAVNAFSYANIKSLIYRGDVYSWLKVKNKGYVSIPTDLVFDGVQVKRLELPKDVVIIPEYAFNSCYKLEEVILHDKVVEIKEGAFFGSGIQCLVIPASVKKIGISILKCTDVERVDLYAKPSVLNAFNAQELFVHLSIKDWCDIKKNDFNVEELHFVDKDDEVITEIFDFRVKKIAAFSFYHCEDLERVFFQNAVDIGNNAFEGCNFMFDIYIPSALSVGAHAFKDCWNIESIFLPEGLMELGNCAFYNCEVLSELYLPSTLEKVGSALFIGCYELNSIRCGGASPRKGWASDWNVASYGDASFKGYSINDIVWNAKIEE